MLKLNLVCKFFFQHFFFFWFLFQLTSMVNCELFSLEEASKAFALAMHFSKPVNIRGKKKEKKLRFLKIMFPLSMTNLIFKSA